MGRGIKGEEVGSGELGSGKGHHHLLRMLEDSGTFCRAEDCGLEASMIPKMQSLLCCDF